MINFILYGAVICGALFLLFLFGVHFFGIWIEDKLKKLIKGKK